MSGTLVLRLGGPRVRRRRWLGLVGFGGGGEFAGLETEEFLDFAVEQLVIVVRKLAIGIGAFEIL